jgi:hypothetical protein
MRDLHIEIINLIFQLYLNTAQLPVLTSRKLSRQSSVLRNMYS